MSETDIVATGIKLPRIGEVRCVDGRRRVIGVTWGNGPREGRSDRVDLSPLIDTFKFYRSLRNDAALFATVHTINGGSALAWGNADEIDMAADSVMRLAEETMTADDFRHFLERNNLTQEAAALLLGRSPRQLKYYLSAGVLPRIVSLACIGLELHGLKAGNTTPVGRIRANFTMPAGLHGSGGSTTVGPPDQSHLPTRKTQLS
jgi:hypothetical protein